MTSQECLCLIVQRCSKPCLFVSLSFREDGKGAKTFQEENLFHKTCLVQKIFLKHITRATVKIRITNYPYMEMTLKKFNFKYIYNKERKLINTLKVAKRKCQFNNLKWKRIMHTFARLIALDPINEYFIDISIINDLN